MTQFEPMAPHPDEPFAPRAMREPRVLYRSMALEELGEVMRTGRVTGGGSLFSWGEPRRYAFFGDVLNDHLLSQGEQVDRRVVFAMKNHPLERQASIGAIARRSVARRIKRELRKDGIYLDQQDLEDFVSVGLVESLRSIIRSVQGASNCDRAKYASMVRTYRRIDRESDGNYKKKSLIMRTLFSEQVRMAANQPYTSAVIVTRPILGGLEYREQAWNGGDAEYCFRPGQVTVEDISHILLVKSGKIVQTIYRERFGEVQSLVEDAIRVEPAEEATFTYGSPERGGVTITCKAGEDVRWTESGHDWLCLLTPWLFCK